MQIDALMLRGFRNYNSQKLIFDKNCNVIYGENAQGKTNLLEAIMLLACGKSPRTHSDRELIGFEREEAVIEGNIISRNREFLTNITLQNGKKKKISVNGVAQKQSSGLSEIFRCVFFSPEDLFLIKEGAAARRKFMDISLCQLRPKYEKILAEYSRLYEHKTRILRDAEEYPQLLDTLPEFNERLCQTGAILIHYRAGFCRALAQYASAAHWECSGEKEKLTLTYETVKTVTEPLADIRVIYEQLKEHQASHYQAELASKLCLSGPHKDDIAVIINGKSAKQFASQGQIRTAALALKLAEREIHKNTFGEYPVMLLDDVLSELDAKRQEYVLNRISGGQIFITCCESDPLNTLLSGKVFHIKSGEIV